MKATRCNRAGAGAVVIGIGTPLAITATGLSTVVGLGQAIFTGNTTILKNEAKLIGGLFTGSGGQIASRLTWELPQTILGYEQSQFANAFGRVKDVSYYDGATVVKHYKNDFGGYTLGSYINGDSDIKADPTNSLFQHEYGHYLQSQSSGWGYLTKYAIKSGLSSDDTYVGAKKHMATKPEQDANRRAREHFGKEVWDYKENPIFGSGENNPFDQEFGPEFDPDFGKPRNGSHRR